MLELNNISIAIGEKTIVEEVNLFMEKGKFISIIGPNGSGKSTILKSVSKLLKTRQGDIIVEDRDIKLYGNKEYAKIVSMLSQHNKAIEGITVEDVVLYGRLPYKTMFSSITKADYNLVEEVLREADIYNLRDRVVTELSGGELQRVFLASSFCQEPELLLLDEPTNHLDIKHQYNLLNKVKERVIRDGLTVVCVLHDINQSLRFADRVVMVKDGRIKFYGKTRDVITEERIREVFEVDSVIHQVDNRSYVEFI